MKQSIDSQLQSETPIHTQADIETSGYAYIYGGVVGSLVTPEFLRKANKAQDRLPEATEEKDKKQPPKPPSRPNAQVGGLAVENA